MALILVQEIPLSVAAWYSGSAVSEAIAGRIDHFAIDVERKRIFVACLGNNTVEVVDAYVGLKVHTLGRRPGEELSSPTGLCFVRGASLGMEDKLYVANAGGYVSVFYGAALDPQRSNGPQACSPPKRIAIPDADNLRYLPDEGLVLVGGCDGEITAISVASDELCLSDGGGSKRIGWLLEAHPESFQVVAGVGVVVNIAEAGAVVALPLPLGAPAAWTAHLPESLGSNFAMTINADAGHVLVVTRRAPALLVLDARTGAFLEEAIEPSDSARCAPDADDVFFDKHRRRVYVIGGAGRVSVFQFTPSQGSEGTGGSSSRSGAGGRYALIQQVDTAIGARTGTWFAERHRLYVAAPATSLSGARLLVYEATTG